MNAPRHQPGDMGHIDMQPGPGLFGNIRHAREINLARIGRATRDQQFGPQRQRLSLQRIVINHLSLGINAVMMRLKPAA